MIKYIGLFLAAFISSAVAQTISPISSGGGGSTSIVAGMTPITSGTNTRVLFDDSGTVGEDAGLTYTKGTGQLSLGGKTVTTSNPILNGSQTWNASGVAFTGSLLNVTDTASAAASLLMDLQKGGVSQFSVNKSGAVQIGPAGPFLFAETNGGLTIGTVSTSSEDYYFSKNVGIGYALRMRSDAALAWSPNTGAGGGVDLSIWRDAANTLALRNATAAQKFSVYNTFTDASNYERGIFDWTGDANSLLIGTEKAGTGVARDVHLQAQNSIYFKTGNSGTVDYRWYMDGVGLKAYADNTYDIGASGGNRPRTGYFGTQVNSPNFGITGAGNILNISGYTWIAPAASGTIVGGPVFIGSNGSSNIDVILTRSAAATLQHGAVDAAAPVAQTTQVQSVVAGTSNTAGTDWTFNASRGTGTGAGGKFIFQTAAAGTTGTAQNALAAALTIDTAGNVGIGNGLRSTGTASVTGVYPSSSGFNSYYNGVIYFRSELGYNTLQRDLNLSWGSSGVLTPDLFLGRMGAAGRFGVLNDTNAAILDVYGTTDARGGTPTNYERLSFTKVIGGAAILDVQHGGTGAASTQFAIKLDGTTKLDYGVTNAGGWTFATDIRATGNNVYASSLYASLSVEATGAAASAYLGFSSSAIIQSPSAGIIKLGNYAIPTTSFNRLQFGGETSSFPAIKRSGPAVALRRADDTVGVFADLPAAATGNEGAIYAITDGSTATWGATVSGGGANHVMIRSNGTAWTVFGS